MKKELFWDKKISIDKLKKINGGKVPTNATVLTPKGNELKCLLSLFRHCD
ncbi:hypothetical protein [Companilactobacillus sp. HBUAS56257]